MNSVEVLESPIKSENDKKEYRSIKLSNGLKVLLIKKVQENESNFELAAANLVVGVGSFDDPPNVGGLAHFLEHMLFMGSEKYPEESGYSDFVSANGGDINAETQDENTTYYFTIAENSFPEALDRFAQQFISPLLLKDALERERESVDSEFQMNLQNDELRMRAFWKSLINESHPASFFDWGNLKTLKEDITDDNLFNSVREFFNKYVANNMCLTVQSNRDLDELQQLVLSTFSEVKSGEISKRSSQKLHEIFKPEFHEKMFFVKPKSTKTNLYLKWCLESIVPYFKCRPLSYVKAIFDNDGEGGIANYLREKKLSLSVSMGDEFDVFSANTMFNHVTLCVELTDFGLENVEKVLEAIFSYLFMIKDSPIEEHRRLYNEYKEQSETSFKYFTELSAQTNVENGSFGMKYFDPENVLRSHSVFLEFDEKIISDFVNALNERKFNLTILTAERETFEKREKYFGVEYDETDFPEEYLKLWNERKANPEFFLQKTNPFKPTNFEIFMSEQESPKYPIKIHESSTIEVWHKLDDKFKMPHAFLKIKLISPKHLKSAYNCLLLKLYEKMLANVLAKKVFAAKSAGLNYSTSVTSKGFEISFYGYNEKLHLLLDVTLQTLKNVFAEVDESSFEVQKTDLMQGFKDSLQSVTSLCQDVSSKILVKNFWTKNEYCEEIGRISFEDLQKFVSKFFRKMKVYVLVQGNMTKNQVSEAVAKVENAFSCEPIDYEYELKSRGYQIPLGEKTLRVKSMLQNDDNSRIENYYQIGSASIRKKCLSELLKTVLDPKAFDFLRTKHQLGYSAGVEFRSKGDVFGFSVVVESQESKHTCQQVHEKIETFMKETARKMIEELTSEEFQSFKDAQIKVLSAEDLTILAEVNRNWNEITSSHFVFNRNELKCNVTQTLTKSDLQDFFNSFTKPENLRKLNLQVVGNLTDQQTSGENNEMKFEISTEKMHENDDLISSIDDFKESLVLFPPYEIDLENL